MGSTDSVFDAASEARLAETVDSYKRLAEVWHEILSEQSLDALLEKIADALAEIVPYDTLTIYRADERQRTLTPVLARDQWAEEILQSRSMFGRGITGWAVEHREPVLANDACADPRVTIIPGTPNDPEALITIPLVSRGSILGALNIYRLGEALFSDDEFELAKRFGDAAALALDNAHTKATLEHQAQTDSLTGLYNHRFFHDRLRAELMRAARSHDTIAVLMLDIDGFKSVNDVFGHGVGDQVLQMVAEIMTSAVRASDLVCRLGGEEFGIVMPSCDAGDALGLASRLTDRLAVADFDPAGHISVSVGVAQGPEHASNPRELVACAEAAMMAAKMQGGMNRVVLYDEHSGVRPAPASKGSDIRSIAHLKMLQSLAGKLNRLNDVREIGSVITKELRTLIDYHSCRVYVIEGDDLVPVAWRGDPVSYATESEDLLRSKVGRGMTGRAAATGRPVLVPNALECDFAVQVPGTEEIEESVVAVPLRYGSRVIGVVVISKLGIDQFDQADVRLLEVLAGQASVALENARLYEAQRREAQSAKSLLDFADSLYQAPTVEMIAHETVRSTARMLDATQCSLWFHDDKAGWFACVAHVGYVDDPTAAAIVRNTVATQTGERLIENHKAPYVVSAEEAEQYFDVPEGTAFRAVAVAPLQPDEGLRGWIEVRDPSLGAAHFGEERLRLLAGISYQASVAIEKARLYKGQKENADVARALLEFGRQLSAAEGMDEVLNRIVDLAARILGSPKISVWLQDPESGDMVAEAVWGFTDDERRRIVDTRFGVEVATSLLASPEPFILHPEDKLGVPGATQIGGGHLISAVAPMKVEGRMGCIVAAAPVIGRFEFSERKMRLLSGIAHQAKLALANAINFENLERTFLTTVESLVNALEAKDEYTSAHTRSIVDTALQVGHELELDAKTLKRLELGALFHDIGKIGVPSDILLKPGPLTDAEWDVIYMHPELGERILGPIDRLADVRPIVRHCHERFDGQGYPDGLAGEDIPIESRIILVCDAFNAMTTDRPYRVKMSMETACARLKECSGTHFDPVVVRAFLRLLA